MVSLAYARRQFLVKMAGGIGALGLMACARERRELATGSDDPNGSATAGGFRNSASGDQAQLVADDERELLNRLASPAQSAHHVPAGDGYVYIKGLGLPDHATGPFPNPHCPGAILAQNHNFRLVQTPGAASTPTPLAGWLFGIAVNGVVFDPTGPFYYSDPQTQTAYEFEVLTSTARPALGLDNNNAHTQPSGEYHYHGMPQGLVSGLYARRAQRGQADRMLLLGWAADGFPIYAPSGHSDPQDPASPLTQMRSSYTLRSGPRDIGGRYDDRADGLFVQDFQYVAGRGDLDACNGRYGVTPEYPAGTYHYFITPQFPFVPRMWRGTPDSSFWHPSPGYDAVPPELRTIQL